MSIIRKYPTTVAFVALFLPVIAIVAFIEGPAVALSTLVYFSLIVLAWLGLVILGGRRFLDHHAD